MRKSYYYHKGNNKRTAENSIQSHSLTTMEEPLSMTLEKSTKGQ